ncbi:hypothetical protein F9288_05695 [Sphingomonas sp. CL5.1]|uniref:hypothetical protein n=1 Tax=Sphingomonas sp. CL5.1 TaxID=2653203 RepID=UPI0015840D98|nr:hypothetical protein [Sphingomonas sp. CL5.1]QKR99200.1 hypothetical protein F9288_05695 [Sphingomonas sp. CL5.1]
MSEYENRWLPAGTVLSIVSTHFAASLNLNRDAASSRAREEILELLVAGTLLASPKGFLLPFADQNTEIERWFWFHRSESDGRKTEDYPESRLGQNVVTIPSDFWLPFRDYCGGAYADWNLGNFHITKFVDTNGGELSGSARNVLFDSIDLPAAWVMSSKTTVQATETASSESSKKRGGGRHRTWDWDGALLHLAAVAHLNPDGLLRNNGNEPNQSDIGKILGDWFFAQHDNSPHDSQLRAYGQKFQEAVDKIKAEKSK